MNFDMIIAKLDDLVFAKTGKKLTQREIDILEGDWKDLTYEQIAHDKALTVNYIKGHLAPMLWERLSITFGEEINKRNWKKLITEKLVQQPQQPKKSKTIALPASRSNTLSKIGNPPNISLSNQVNEQLEKVKQWVVNPNSRLVALLGNRGIGKTTIATKIYTDLKRERANRFQNLFWVCLRYPYPLHDLLNDLLDQFQVFDVRNSKNINEKISRLIQLFQESPNLLVIDHVDNLLEKGTIAGQYTPAYQDYSIFFRRLIEEFHQSCILLASREMIPELEFSVATDASVRAYEIQGLSQDDLADILKSKSIQYEPAEIEKLLKAYEGNPLFLKIAIAFIEQVCQSSLATFFEFDTLVFGKIENLAQEDYERLSDNERKITKFLAQQNGSIGQEKLCQANLLSNRELMNALASLKSRYLLETSKNSKTQKVEYKLQEILKEHTRKRKQLDQNF
jgi:NACHT domain